MLDMRSSARAVADDQDDGGLSEFVVYDDGDAAGIPTPVGTEAWRDDPEIDPAKLAVSRNVLYGQGILLVVVAGLALLVGYVLGAAVGGGSDQEQVQGPARFSGRLRYQLGNDQLVPDVGSVVIVLPVDRKPDEKVPPSGLRPDEPPPNPDHRGVAMLESIGGGYDKADAQGDFDIRVPRAGNFVVLYISGNSAMNPDKLPDKNDIVKVGRYLSDAMTLIGGNRYRVESQSIHGHERSTQTFANP